MDNLTHSLAGVLMARAGLARKLGPGTTLALLIGSNLPDVDIALALFEGDKFFLHRRMLTHSVFGLPVLATLGATVLALVRRRQPWPVSFALLLLGAAVHVGFDLLNSYGVCCLHPASSRRFELSWVFIIDLCMLAILAAPLALAISRKLRGPNPSRAALICVLLYVSLCGAARARSRKILERIAHAGEHVAGIFPEPFGPHRFRGVLRRGPVMQSYLVRPAEGTAEFLYRTESEEESPLLREARATTEVRELEWFFAVPVWRILPDGRTAEVHDLRFSSAVLGRERIPFTVRVPLSEGEPRPGSRPR